MTRGRAGARRTTNPGCDFQGVLLRTTGQKGDAERMFIQAKYLAPKEAMSVVQRVINPK